MADLAQAVQGAVGQPASVRVGVVESASPLVITAQGVPFEDVGLLNGYVPQVGDTVVLLGQCSEAGSDPASWVALGSTSVDSPMMQGGRVAMSVSAATSATAVVTFATPFKSIPVVSTNLETGAGASAGWGSRAITISTTGFTAFIFGAAATFSADVGWQAQLVTQ